ncbi:MAG: enoyl-CoA hydratase/isomerase family protein [Streptosporangiaceae bacterium]|jgi:enoyl-CoA hydratase/carnithine racemase
MPSAAASLVILEQADRYAVITLNRPAKLNAMSRKLLADLHEALAALPARVRAVVLTGAGQRAFTAGNDLTEAAPGRPGSPRGPLYQVLDLIRQHPAVFIAAVNGYALGGGLSLVNTCELAIASATAEFGIPQLGFGAFPGAAAPMLHRVLPKRAALAILSTYRVDAATALAWGIVSEVVPQDELRRRAVQVARCVASREPAVIAAAQQALRRASSLGQRGLTEAECAWEE